MLVGRDSELSQVSRLLQAAGSGQGGALAVTGPAGIGKSALLDAASAVASGLTVVRVVGVEAERDVPYAGLHAVLAALVDDEVLASLPAPQERALSVALGLRDGDAPGRLALGAATLGVLAARHGLAILVDDLQWIDAPSADALCFAARRLVAEPVAILVSLRTEGGLPADSPAVGLPRLELSGLSDVTGLVPSLPAHVARALGDATAGNPLAVIESAAALAPEEATGLVPLPRQLPPSDPERLFGARLATLSPDHRAAARVAALAGRAPAAVLRTALGTLGLSLDRLAPLESLGMCRPTPTPVWRHPLARAAAARGEPGEVRAAHAALAAAWGSDAGAARAWHLAEAADGPDPAAVSALREAAQEAERRDASSDAADAWERAARLVEQRAERAVLLEAAGRAALRAGATRRASRLLDEALQHQSGAATAARLLHQRGRIEHALGNPERALHLFLQAVDLASEPDDRVRAAAEGLYSAMYAGRPDQATRMAELAELHHDPDDPVHLFLVVHARGAAASLRDEPELARAAMDQARALLSPALLEQEPDLALWAVNIELFDPVGQEVPPAVLGAMDRMRAAGDLTWLPRVTRLVALRQLARGHWASAQSLLDEAEIVSRMSGQTTQLAEALLQLAELDAVQGRSNECLGRLAEATERIDELEVTFLDQMVGWVRAVDHLTQERDADAASVLTGMRLDSTVGPVLAELLLRTSGPAAVRELLDSDLVTEAARGIVSALVDPDEAVGAAALAASAETTGAPVEEALRRTWAGERYRRAGQRVLAREQLRRAHDVFGGLGATPWTARVEDELRASGATLHRGGDGTRLTPSEQRIAAMVAGGRSNKEVASALYLSPKTVEFHLGRIYRKLGVPNRTALAGALRNAGPTTSEAS